MLLLRLAFARGLPSNAVFRFPLSCALIQALNDAARVLHSLVETLLLRRAVFSVPWNEKSRLRLAGVPLQRARVPARPSAPVVQSLRAQLPRSACARQPKAFWLQLPTADIPGLLPRAPFVVWQAILLFHSIGATLPQPRGVQPRRRCVSETIPQSTGQELLPQLRA